MDPRIRQIQQIQQDRNNGVPIEAGYGTIGQYDSMYYEVGMKGDPNRIDIFPDGMPHGPHQDMPHGHIVVQGNRPIFGR